MTMELNGEEVVSPLIFETVHPMDGIRVWGAARRLLDALDRMNGRENLSLNVREARDDLRALVEFHEGQRGK